MRQAWMALALILTGCSASETSDAEQAAEISKAQESSADAPPSDRPYTGTNRERFEAFALNNLDPQCLPDGYEFGQEYDPEGSTNLIGWNDEPDLGTGPVFEVVIWIDSECFEALERDLKEQTLGRSSEVFAQPVREVGAFFDADGGPTFMIHFGG